MRLDRPKMPPDGSSGVTLPPPPRKGWWAEGETRSIESAQVQEAHCVVGWCCKFECEKHGGSQSRLALGYEGSRSKLNREKEPFLILLSAGKACDNLWDMYKMVFT